MATPQVTQHSDASSLDDGRAQVPETERAAHSARRLNDRPIRVMLVDDHRIMREGLRALLRSKKDMIVVGEADNGVTAIAVAITCSPDVVVMDLSMPKGGGADATRQLMSLKCPPAVLILTMHDEADYIIPLLECGARGFLTKDAAEQELEQAIREVAAGALFVRPRVANLLAAYLGPDGQRTPENETRAQFAKLSARERDVLKMVAEGYNGPEIGERLGITSKSVDTYKCRIEQKTGLRHRTAYVKFASEIARLQGYAPDL